VKLLVLEIVLVIDRSGRKALLLKRLESQGVLGVCDTHSVTDLIGLSCGVAVVSREEEEEEEEEEKDKGVICMVS
jgi:hypothetical protein